MTRALFLVYVSVALLEKCKFLFFFCQAFLNFFSKENRKAAPIVRFVSSARPLTLAYCVTSSVAPSGHVSRCLPWIATQAHTANAGQ